jgi:S1-C subfamily serine protease/Flp pilus assembly protein TadD
MKVVILTLFLINASASLCLADTIYFKDGKKIEAKIIEKTDKYIKINYYDVVLTHWWDEIDHIEEEEPSVSKQKTDMVQVASTITGEKTPVQIFEEVAPGVVVIVAKSSTGFNQGSGFIVDKSGVIVTNLHVVAGAEKINVRLKDGRLYPVTGIIEYDQMRDICVLKIDAPDLVTIPLGNSNSLKQGQKILVIGAPLGLEYSISDGLYSGLRGEIAGLKSLQFTAPTSPGNSGGPLLDMQGRVLGVTTFVITAGQNLNFAIPVNDIKSFIHTNTKISVEEFSRSLNKVYSLYNSALEAYSAGKIDLAIDYVKQAIAIEQNDAALHCLLACAYSDKGMFNEAIDEAKQAVFLKPDALNHSNLGKYYASRGMFDEAITEFKQVLAFDPDDSNAHSDLGGSYIWKGDLSEGIAECNRAITLDPSNAYAYGNLAEGYYRSGKYDLAVKYCDKAIEFGAELPSDFLKKIDPYRK